MCNMAKGDTARWLARATCLFFVALLFVAGPSARRADAQEVTTAFKIVPVAVLDFANQTRYGGDRLGGGAADALVLSLAASGHFDPLERGQVTQALQELGLGAPLGNTAQQRLGDHLKVAGVITGEVRKVEFVNMRSGALTARVTMGAVMLDVTPGSPSTEPWSRPRAAPIPATAPTATCWSTRRCARRPTRSSTT